MKFLLIIVGLLFTSFAKEKDICKKIEAEMIKATIEYDKIKDTLSTAHIDHVKALIDLSSAKTKYDKINANFRKYCEIGTVKLKPTLKKEIEKIKYEKAASSESIAFAAFMKAGSNFEKDCLKRDKILSSYHATTQKKEIVNKIFLFFYYLYPSGLKIAIL